MKDVLKVFKSLSDPTRLRIVLLLLQRELCVCELMFILKMEQSRISHQLRILRDTDLVEDSRQGRWVIYRITDGSRKGLEHLMKKSLGRDLGASKEIAADIKGLEKCLQEDIRRKHCLSPDRTVEGP